MDKIYYYTGFGLIWVLIGAISIVIIVGICFIIFGLSAKVWKESFFFNFYIRRKRYETEKLRMAYINYYDNKLFTKYTIKFRLRNIKDLKK